MVSLASSVVRKVVSCELKPGAVMRTFAASGNTPARSQTVAEPPAMLTDSTVAACGLSTCASSKRNSRPSAERTCSLAEVNPSAGIEVSSSRNTN